MLTIAVRDFGPIREGSLRLRPLTALIGPNNAGKSYLATLIYALSRQGVGRGIPPVIWPFRIEAELRSKLERTRLSGLLQRLGERDTFAFAEVPPADREALRSLILQTLANAASMSGPEIRRCFGTPIKDLRRKAGAGGFQVRLEQDQPRAVFVFSSSGDDLQLGPPEVDLSSFEFKVRRSPHVPPSMQTVSLLLQAVGELLTPMFRRAYYFPAARSGILQGHKALASFVVSRLPLVGVEPLEIPRLTGVVADFIANLLGLERGAGRGARSAVASFLEKELCRGRLDLQVRQAEFEYPEIFYQRGEQKFALHQTSSMISEVAPIVLFLKHVVDRDDLLIIEEPEAHLHPDSQRIMARALAKLVRSGIKLLITTHSDYLVHQLSNLVQFSSARDKARSLGYGEDEYLKADEVSVALFHFPDGANGSMIEELVVTEEEGIPQDEFVRIAEAIYDETTALEYGRSRPE